MHEHPHLTSLCVAQIFSLFFHFFEHIIFSVKKLVKNSGISKKTSHHAKNDLRDAHKFDFFEEWRANKGKHAFVPQCGESVTEKRTAVQFIIRDCKESATYEPIFGLDERRRAEKLFQYTQATFSVLAVQINLPVCIQDQIANLDKNSKELLF